MSVHLYRLTLRRAKEAESRNKNPRCACQVGSPTHVVKSKKRGQRAIVLARHGALHGVFGKQGCPHSETARTTASSRFALVKVKKPIATVVFR